MFLADHPTECDGYFDEATVISRTMLKVTHLLAMQEVRGHFPLNALLFRTWESLGFRLLWAQEIAGSNPAVLTRWSFVACPWSFVWDASSSADASDNGQRTTDH